MLVKDLVWHVEGYHSGYWLMSQSLRGSEGVLATVYKAAPTNDIMARKGMMFVVSYRKIGAAISECVVHLADGFELQCEIIDLLPER